MKKLSDKVTFKHGAVISNRMVQHKDKWGEADAFPMAVANAVFGVVKKYVFDNFIIGYRISPEEINPDNVGYTWHNVMNQADAEDALNYTDLVTAGRTQIIDASFSTKVVAGEDDKIIKRCRLRKKKVKY